MKSKNGEKLINNETYSPVMAIKNDIEDVVSKKCAQLACDLAYDEVIEKAILAYTKVHGGKEECYCEEEYLEIGKGMPCGYCLTFDAFKRELTNND